MAVFLVQHGESFPEEVDPARHLTPEGERTVEKMAVWAQRVGLEVQRIVHSGKERARQTAEILAAALMPPGGVMQEPGLGPRDDPTPWPEWLARQDGTMIVGHLPFLARLAGLMLGGAPDRAILHFVHAGIVCLDRQADNSGWVLSWAVWPSLLLEDPGEVKMREALPNR
ncbi:MAG: phosphohistidine phosphatase SixA [candidate division KSB1 bacterium]|nr:phosphohistidine phosphatase SixA [candidate division KSB1 bacterium]